jgi:hypothetical protein
VKKWVILMPQLRQKDPSDCPKEYPDRRRQLRAVDSAQRAGKPVLRSQARERTGNGPAPPFYDADATGSTISFACAWMYAQSGSADFPWMRTRESPPKDSSRPFSSRRAWVSKSRLITRMPALMKFMIFKRQAVGMHKQGHVVFTLPSRGSSSQRSCELSDQPYPLRVYSRATSWRTRVSVLPWVFAHPRSGFARPTAKFPCP